MKKKRLWETGAPLLLAEVWGVSEHIGPQQFTLSDGLSQAETSIDSRQKIGQQRIDQIDHDRFFTGKVCDEDVCLTLSVVNHLHGTVENRRTLLAILNAHDVMYDPKSFLGRNRLDIDIQVLDSK